MTLNPELVHATAIAINGRGVLLSGKSGVGKSDLAIRLIDRGAKLVCDDYCDIIDGGDYPYIVAKPTIAGKFELRGVGILKLDYVEKAPLFVVFQLDQQPERLPDSNKEMHVAGWSIPSFAIAPIENSAPLKVEYLIQQMIDAGRRPMRLVTPGYKRSAV